MSGDRIPTDPAPPRRIRPDEVVEELFTSLRSGNPQPHRSTAPPIPPKYTN